MSLENEISRYESALKALQDESIPIEEKVSNLLSVRDSISGVINKDAAVTLEQRRKLAAFDQLFQKESSVVHELDEQTFIRWRNCVQPPDDAWWWCKPPAITATSY